MQRNILFQSLRHLVHSRFAIICGLFAMILLFVVWWWMTDLDLSLGNRWKRMFCFQIILYLFFCVLFGLFVAATVYKIRLYWTSDKHTSGIWAIWWFLGILVAWCPACAVSIASYIGLASIVSLLPRGGIELKIAWVLLVWYAARKALVTMEVCELRTKDK